MPKQCLRTNIVTITPLTVDTKYCESGLTLNCKLNGAWVLDLLDENPIYFLFNPWSIWLRLSTIKFLTNEVQDYWKSLNHNKSKLPVVLWDFFFGRNIASLPKKKRMKQFRIKLILNILWTSDCNTDLKPDTSYNTHVFKPVSYPYLKTNYILLGLAR